MGAIADARQAQAESAARTLVDQADADAVLLFGSVARGDAGPASDIDLMVVSEQPPRARSLRATLGEEHRSLAVVCHSWQSVARAAAEDWSFFVHLREDGELLHDPDSRLRSVLSSVGLPTEATRRRQLEEEGEDLDAFDDLSRFGAGYQFPLARIYRTARYVCMYDNTAAGRIAFNRERAFDAFAERHRAVEREVESLRVLWPFLARTQGRRDHEVPFPPDRADRVLAAQGAARALLRAALEG